MERVTVALPDAPYDVVVGAGALADAGALLAGRRRVAVVSQPGVADFHAPALLTALQQAGVATDLFLMGDGEDAKSLATVDDLCSRFAAWGLLRGDAVVALGGGVVGDTAGFAASVYHRGVAVLQAPTTLLAKVDAAIGGKTAVNLPEGKNLVGAFHQPVARARRRRPRSPRCRRGVPLRSRRGGEVRAHARWRARRRDRRARSTPPSSARDVDVLADLVAACAAMKAHVVGVDPHERTGLRATLNLGHTLAHALESVGGYELLHGEAVAVGSRVRGCARRRDGAHRRRRRRPLPQRGRARSICPPRCRRSPSDRDALVASMRRDKKSVGGLTFVLPGPVGLETVHDPDARALDVAFAAVGVGG